MLIPTVGQGLGIVLFLAVLVGAWYGGLGPGILATALTAYRGGPPWPLTASPSGRGGSSASSCSWRAGC